MIERRLFLLGSLTLLTVPVAADGQQTRKLRRVGFLSRSGEAAAQPFVTAFREAMRVLGYVEGDTVAIDWRWAGERDERLTEMAVELVRAGMEVIVAAGTLETRAVQQATSTIPIVMVHVADPVAAGFVDSLSRPGKNITGLSMVFPELSVKQLELFREALVGPKIIGVLWNPANPSHLAAINAMERAALRLGVSLDLVSTQASGGLAQAFATARKNGAGAILVLGEPFIFAQRTHLAELGLKNQLATMFLLRQHVEVGGLMSYGVDGTDLFRRAAVFVDKLLQGAKAAGLPIEQPTKFQMVVNLKTAKALGLTIPPSLLLRADQVIE